MLFAQDVAPLGVAREVPRACPWGSISNNRLVEWSRLLVGGRMIKNPILKNILSDLVVTSSGFMLLNLTFMGFAFVTKFFELILPFNLVPISGLIAGSVIIAAL